MIYNVFGVTLDPTLLLLLDQDHSLLVSIQLCLVQPHPSCSDVPETLSTFLSPVVLSRSVFAVSTVVFVWRHSIIFHITVE